MIINNDWLTKLCQIMMVFYCIFAIIDLYSSNRSALIKIQYYIQYYLFTQELPIGVIYIPVLLVLLYLFLKRKPANIKHDSK